MFRAAGLGGFRVVLQLVLRSSGVQRSVDRLLVTAQAVARSMWLHSEGSDVIILP